MRGGGEHAGLNRYNAASDAERNGGVDFASDDKLSRKGNQDFCGYSSGDGDRQNSDLEGDARNGDEHRSVHVASERGRRYGYCDQQG
jgi:hypothetical protein